MGIRRTIIEYSRGNDLWFFWFLYRLQKKAGNRLLHGIFISRYAQIGENCRIYQNVTIGEVNREAPVIGDYCLIGAGAVIIGNIRIGNHVKVGAGAVVEKDVPDYCTVVSQPVRLLEGKKED